jgi:enoyl-CoA hydratase
MAHDHRPGDGHDAVPRHLSCVDVSTRGISVSTERVGRVLVIRLDREAKRNAIDQAMSDGIEAALDELESTDELWAGVLTGTATIFSAGTDLSTGRSPRTDRGGEYGVIRRARTKPLVAGVEGWALGGGFEITLACDVVVAADDARFGLPEVARGVVATSGALFRASRALPLHVAKDLLLTGAPIPARRAYELGLVSRLCAPGTAAATAIEVATTIAGNGPIAVRATLAALDTPVADDRAGWRVTETAMAAIAGADDTAEGVRAFFEKRPPHWTNR